MGSLALAATMALGLTSCSDSGSDKPDAASSAGAEADAEKVKAALDAGLAAHADGDLTTAAEKYDEVLEYDPDNPAR
jgi:Tfp pilus assembly protein PilF